MVKIDLLKNHPDAVPVLAKLWYEQEAVRILHPKMTLEEAQTRFIPTQDDTFPILFAAFADDKPVGMCGLRAETIIRPDLTPWAFGLIVDSDYHQHGIANTLLAATLLAAKKLDYKKIYGLTINPIVPDWVCRHGWQQIGTEQYHDTPIIVLEIDLATMQHMD